MYSILIRIAQGKGGNKMTKVGIDIGNYDSKSEHTKIPSSFQESVTKNELAPDWIEYNGNNFM